MLATADEAKLRGWIGRSDEAEDGVTQRLLDGFRATFEPHLAPMGEAQAPLGLHWCLAPPAVPMAELGPDGHPVRGGFLPPVPLPRRMWAGGELETAASLTVGDSVTRRSTISEVMMKEGRSGQLCFVAVNHAFSTERGVVIRERHDIVYRPIAKAEGAALPPVPAPARKADLAWRVVASPVLLFRYSALTFNGHRIHYDHPYVTGTEGYAGLVVHGPVQATLLLNIAAVLAGRVSRCT